MLVKFIGRRDELQVLESAYHARESAFIPIYGRRRVGKSELILRFLDGKRGIYFLGKKAPAGLQIREFLEEAATVLGDPLLATFPADSWKAALGAVAGRWSKQEKLLLVFDEFQWTAKVSPELPSVLQELWDRSWRRSGNAFLILCGSYVGFMERTILGKKSPLFGRRTAQILLKPFPYRETAEFHPGYSLADRARTYFVCGGVPLYLQQFSAQRSVEMNIAQNLLSEFAPLFREPDFLIREELREVENYYAILLAAASGHSSNKEISRASGVGERALHYYLQQLMELGYLRRSYPLTDRRPTARQVRYVLDDPLLRFWFRFVYPSLSSILRMGPERALRERIRGSLDSYFGTCFEGLCREALPHLYAREGVTASFEVGEYWDRSTQIDVVGLRDDGWTDLGECKWGTGGKAKEILADLDEKARRYPNARNATIGKLVFTRKPRPGKPPEDPQVRWHCLEDLYA